MQTLSRILLPVDFSERSLGASGYAMTLARHFGSELILLHVLPPPHYEFGALEIGGSMLSELYTSRTAQVEQELAEFLPGPLEGITVRRVVLEGDPGRKIVEFAHGEHVGMIVMPTHGYGQFRRFILGSITAKVLHDANCPVWTGVHLEETPVRQPNRWRHILCGLDLGVLSCRTLEWASGLAKEFGAQLTVLHVAPCPADPASRVEAGWHEEMERRARETIADLQQTVGSNADVLVGSGDPPKTICAEARRLQADLLVIGRGSAAGVFGRLRTNAYAIIRQSPCPVVSV